MIFIYLFLFAEFPNMTEVMSDVNSSSNSKFEKHDGKLIIFRRKITNTVSLAIAIAYLFSCLTLYLHYKCLKIFCAYWKELIIVELIIHIL